MLLLPKPFCHVCTLFSDPSVRRQDQDQSTEIEVSLSLNLRIDIVIGEGQVDLPRVVLVPMGAGGHRARGLPGSGFGLGHNGDDDLTLGEETGCSSISGLD